MVHKFTNLRKMEHQGCTAYSDIFHVVLLSGLAVASKNYCYLCRFSNEKVLELQELRKPIRILEKEKADQAEEVNS